MASRVLLRRGTAAAWASANPILADGEPGWSTDSDVLKIGDGVHAWSALPAVVAGSTAPAVTNNNNGTASIG